MSARSEGVTVGDLVAGDPRRAKVFDRFGIDFCCHGGESFRSACDAAGADPDALMAELDSVEASGGAAPRDVASMPLGTLAHHVLDTHHELLHRELPQIHALALKVRDVHRERHPELVRVAELVEALRADLEPHLDKEERRLFPAVDQIVRAERTGGDPGPLPVESVVGLLEELRAEHEGAGRLLDELRAAARGFALPADACASYALLYEGLATVDADTRVHVHTENDLLFPATEAAAARVGAP
ncbi:MAG: DUF542 domain-containing protein [Acidimicrobiia bacterium]|nr:DUF542 domain-containing protein [Acidimicrobiia bacterium]